MSRSGYSEDFDDQWESIRWRGAVASAMRGKRGQAFLREMLIAMDALPEKKLIAGDLVDSEGCACALGAVALSRGTDVSKVDPYDYDNIHAPFGIANALAREVMWENDEHRVWNEELKRSVPETPEARFIRMHQWIEAQLIEGDAE